MSEELADYFAKNYEIFRGFGLSARRNFGLTPPQVEDCLQEMWVSAKKTDAYDPNFEHDGTISEDDRMRVFLRRVLINKLIDSARKKEADSSIRNMTEVCKPSDDPCSEFYSSLAVDYNEPSNEIQRTEESLLVRKIIEKLPDKFRDIIHLAYFQHRSYREISEILRIPFGTVKSRLHTAIKNFKEFYELELQTSGADRNP